MSNNQEVNFFETLTKNNYLVNQHNKIILPEIKARNYLLKWHEILGHPGLLKFFKSLEPFWSYADLKKVCYNISSECMKCQICKSAFHHYSKTASCVQQETFNEFISSDIVGPIPTNESQTTFKKEKFFILTIIDIFSRYVMFAAIEKIDSLSIQALFVRWFSSFGAPQKLLTDNESQYISLPFKQFLSRYRVHYIPVSIYYPQGNRHSERINLAISNLLKIEMGSQLKELSKWRKTRLTLRGIESSVFRLSKLFFLPLV